MADNKFNQEQMYTLLQLASRKLNMSPGELAQALSGGNMSSIGERLPADSAAQLQRMLGDPARAQQMLASPQAQELLRRLTEQGHGK